MDKILVVNNDFDTMNLLKNWLEKKNYHVEYTGHTEGVTDLIKEVRPSLVIVDIMQKDAIEEIKKNNDLRHLPILLMTGYTSKSRNKDLPYDDVIEKPFNLSLFQKKIEALIKTNVVSD